MESHYYRVSRDKAIDQALRTIVGLASHNLYRTDIDALRETTDMFMEDGGSLIDNATEAVKSYYGM